ncbi:MAG TPA: hypothetical protein DCY35_03665 [Prolixibacteraceae bacterium]|nr:hypothetical protein [Prolixibacteraceae bacterium]
MLTISINNQNLSLGRDFSVRIGWVNPACFMDRITGDIGLGIELPVNEINRAILGYPERFEKYHQSGDRKFTGAEIRYSGVLLISGTLRITNATAESYSGWLQSEVGVMGEEQRERFITDLPWKENQSFVNKGYNPGYNDNADEYGVFYIRNRGFWDGKGAETTVPVPFLDQNGIPRTKNETGSTMMKKHWENFQYMINVPDELDQVIVSGESCVVSPYLFLRFALKEIFRLNRWYIDRNDMVGEGGITYDLSFWKDLMVYNNFNVIGMDYQTVQLPILDWDNDARNFIDVEVPEVTFLNWGLRPFNYADLVPKIPLKDFLLGIQNTLNMIFVFDRGHKVHIIDRNEIPDADPIDLEQYKIGFWEIGDRKEVTLKFLPEYDKEDSLFGSEFNDLSDRRHDFGDPVDTYTDLLAIASPVFGELRLVKNLNQIFEYKFHVYVAEDANRVENQLDTLGWEFISSGPQPFMYGESDTIEEIRSPLSALQNNPVLNILDTVQKGNMSNMRNVWSDFSLRLINKNEFFYPDALYWEGENGLFEKRWKKWARFWANRLPVQGEFDLPLNVIVSLIHNITNPCRESKGVFVIEEIETEFGLNMIGRTKIKGYKI